MRGLPGTGFASPKDMERRAWGRSLVAAVTLVCLSLSTRVADAQWDEPVELDFSYDYDGLDESVLFAALLAVDGAVALGSLVTGIANGMMLKKEPGDRAVKRWAIPGLILGALSLAGGAATISIAQAVEADDVDTNHPAIWATSVSSMVLGVITLTISSVNLTRYLELSVTPAVIPTREHGTAPGLAVAFSM